MAYDARPGQLDSPHIPNAHSTPSHTPLYDPPSTSHSREQEGNGRMGSHGRGVSRSSSVSTDLELHQLDDPGRDDSDEEAALDGDAKAQRRQQRDNATSPSGRIVDIGATPNEAKLAAKAMLLRKSLINGTLIGLWYLFSVSISVYNKWMFADKDLNFHFPLFTTAFHMVVQFGLASLVLFLFPKFRPRAEVESQRTDDLANPQKPIMSPGFYLTRIAPCAAATGLDIGLGNTSLRFVTLTFFTMCKSSTLGFVLAFAILFRLEKMSWKLAGIITIMTVGVIMMVAGETAFSALGFVLLMLASFFSGLRWSLTQILLKRNPATSNPFASLFFLTPIMFIVLLAIAFPVEGAGDVIAGFGDLSSRKGAIPAFGILLAPGVLAFLMTASEFALLQRTSVVTLSVCGIFKEVLTIAAGSLVFSDSMTPINISGILVTISAIAVYNYMRVARMKQKTDKEALEMTEEQAPMLSAAPVPEETLQGPTHTRTPSTGDIIARSLRASLETQARGRAGSLRQTPPTPRSPIQKSPQNLD